MSKVAQASASAQETADTRPENLTRPLLVGLLVMLLLMCVGLGIGMIELRQMAKTLENVTQKNQSARTAISTMNRVTRERALMMSDILTTADPFDRDAKLLEFDGLARGANEALKKQGELTETEQEKALFDSQMQLIRQLIQQFGKIVSLARQGELDHASDIFHNETLPAQSRMLDTLMRWTEVHYEAHARLVKEAQEQQQGVIRMMFLMTLVSIGVGFLVAGRIYRWNNRMIGQFVQNEANLKATLGDLAFRQQATDAHSIASIADAAGNILYANDKFCEVSGYAREELIGQNHRIVKSDSHPPEFFSDMWQTISSGQVWHGRIRNRAKSGHHYWVETTIVPMMNEDGVPDRYISLRTDITHIMDMEEAVRKANVLLEQKVAERTRDLEQAKLQLEMDLVDRERNQEALQQSYNELESLHQQLKDAQQYLMQSEKLAAVGQLAAGMAHEINNPIGFVTSNLTSMERYLATLKSLLALYIKLEAQLSEDTRTEIVAERKRADLDFVLEDSQILLDECRGGLDRVRKIVRDLRNFARIDTQSEWQLVDLSQSLDSTLDLLGEEYAKGVEIRRDYGLHTQVECNISELNQVFVGLLNNAIQAMKSGGTITLRSGQTGDQAWVEIEDTGEGIPDEVLPHIFDPFFTTRPVGKGSGLGLSMSYGIVRKHGGKISVRSRVGEGTAFRVELPLHQDKAVEAQDENAARGSGVEEATHAD